MKIAVVGSGHGGCAMAAVLAQQGHEVSIVKLGKSMHTDNFRAIHDSRKIGLAGIMGEGEFPLAHVTTNPVEAIPEAELVLIFYVSNYHPMVAKRLAPHLRQDQIVVLNPGYCGSLILAAELKSVERSDLPVFAEFETLPYTSRIGPAGKVTITSKNVRHPFASYPASRAAELAEFFSPVLGKCPARNHILEVALHNPNLVIHTIGVLMNAALVERGDESFAMYRDGFTPSMWNLVNTLDEEKMDVLERLGAPRMPYFDAFRLRTFEDTSVDPIEGFNHYAAEAPAGPHTIEHRYVTEDVPMGLGLLHSLGRLTNVRTPICDSLIDIANGLLPERNFWGEARAIDRLWEGPLDRLLEELSR